MSFGDFGMRDGLIVMGCFVMLVGIAVGLCVAWIIAWAVR